MLEPEPNRGADDVEVAGDADAVVLAQVVEVLRVVFVEDFGGAHCESVAHPTVYEPVVENFVGDVERQIQLV